MRRDDLDWVSVDIARSGSESSLHLGMMAAPAAGTVFSTKRNVAGDPDTDQCPLGAQTYP
jgi:hypothetical protein